VEQESADPTGAGLAIRTQRLTKTYGPVHALDGLDLEVRVGEVYGFLGPNGSGKTTTIRLLLDLIRPTGGSATVLGLDPRRDGLALRRRVGYLGGEFVVEGRQTSAELLRYLGNLRGGVAPSRIDELTERFGLDPSRRISTLSRGNRQKIGVVQAFMHDPELLILDEPTSGLDPVLQHEFASLVGEAASDGRTVFMSSHVMSEVQRVADRVGIIHRGRLTTVEGIDELQRRASRRVEIVFDAGTGVDAATFEAIDEVSEVVVDGDRLRCRLDGRADALVKAAAHFGVATFTAEEPDLEELFMESYGSADADDSDEGPR
jgi:ABC-2 type transport system ATP-binding protein